VWGIGSGGSAETAPYGGAVGVFGQAGGGNTNGVEGHGSGTLAGVAGMGDLSSRGASGIGVFGQGGAPATGSNWPGGPGVHGVGFGSAYTPHVSVSLASLGSASVPSKTAISKKTSMRSTCLGRFSASPPWEPVQTGSRMPGHLVDILTLGSRPFK